MKALKYSFGLALIGGFSLMAACGGSSSDSGATAGDSSGGNGSDTAGTTSTTAGASAGGADSVAGGGATGGASGGTTSQGGASTGTAGAGQGGAVANPPDCPATAPTDAAACTPLATNLERCAYAGESCRCRAMGGPPVMQGTAGGGGAPAAAADVWQCTATCPAAKPTVGADCTQGLNCPYQGEGRCTCGASQKWACAGGAMGTAGAGGAPGAGGAGGAPGAGGAGAANTCPVAKPTVGDACAVTKACAYANSGCVCLQQKWACN
jgi:hypothetical protein